MFNITEHKESDLKHILAVYSNDTMESIEHYKITNNMLGAGKPLSLNLANEIFKNLQYTKGHHLTFNGMIPSNVVHVDTVTQSLIWKVKSHKRKLLFKNKSFKTDEYILPHLVFLLKENIVSVFAIKTYSVQENTKLFNAPFLNVWSDGKVCMGSAVVDKQQVSSYDELMVLVENLFFNSYFTHTNHDIIVDCNLIELYKKLKTENKFPNKVLIPSIKKNVKSLWK